MKIIFDCVGFASASVFLEDSNGRQYHIGYITSKFVNDYEFTYGGIYRGDKPSPEEILNEYKRQSNGKVEINDSIGFAG